MSKFSYGWRKQAFDPRDQFAIVESRKLERLPQSLDLTPGMGPMLNQAALGSCGPNSIAELVAYDDKSQGMLVRTLSRLHFYWWTRYLMGTVGSDSGVDNRTMLKAGANYGFCPDEATWAYDTDKFTQKPPDAANQSGLQNKITDYAAVLQNLPQMQGTLVNGRPFLFGFNVYQQIESDEAAETGILKDPGMFESPVGGHDVAICAYNATGGDLPGIEPGKKFPSGHFRFRNHWEANGKPWGDMGHGYVSFGYSTGPNASDFWVINAVPGGSVTPPPPPPPPIGPPPVGPSTIKKMIDAVFATLEAQYARYPLVVWVLKVVQGYIDGMLPATTGNMMTMGGFLPPSVIAIIDGAFRAAETAYPLYAPIIALVQGLVDKYLGG